MKTHYSLVLLDSPILVSDEEYKTNDQVWDIKDGVQRTVLKPLKDEWCFKIIAGIEGLLSVELPDEVEQVLKEKYGWVDAKRLAEQYIKDYEVFFDTKAEINHTMVGFQEGFKTAQSLNKKKVDITPLVTWLGNLNSDDYHKCPSKLIKETTVKIQSLSNRLVPVEVEMKCLNNIPEADHTCVNKELKITNNSIKITKVN